jgi:hypothetical protein
MAAGVTIVDPATTYIDRTSRSGPTPSSIPACTSRADAHRVRLRDPFGRPHRRLDDRRRGHWSTTSASSRVDVGPGPGRARSRTSGPLSDVGEDAHVGNFVELKKTSLGRGRRRTTSPTSATPPSATASTSAPARSRATTTAREAPDGHRGRRVHRQRLAADRAGPDRQGRVRRGRVVDHRGRPAGIAGIARGRQVEQGGLGEREAGQKAGSWTGTA